MCIRDSARTHDNAKRAIHTRANHAAPIGNALARWHALVRSYGANALAYLHCSSWTAHCPLRLIYRVQYALLKHKQKRRSPRGTENGCLQNANIRTPRQ
eukprot:4479194-Lingulodinium_polyedra.AAC.1